MSISGYMQVPDLCPPTCVWCIIRYCRNRLASVVTPDNQCAFLCRYWSICRDSESIKMQNLDFQKFKNSRWMIRIIYDITPNVSTNIINFGFVSRGVTDCQWITINLTKSCSMMGILWVGIGIKELTIPTESRFKAKKQSKSSNLSQVVILIAAKQSMTRSWDGHWYVPQAPETKSALNSPLLINSQPWIFEI